MDIQCHSVYGNHIILIKKGIRMIFCIQASNPEFKEMKNPDDNSLAEAIESVFSMNTEYAIMMWEHICIPLSYKYDVSYMIDDVLKLLEMMQNEISGKTIVHWLPDTFRCDWQVEWAGGTVHIFSKWECTVGHLENLLNCHNYISLSVAEFISEWKKVLGIVINGLECAGYDQEELDGMFELVNRYEIIEKAGVLYRESY